MEKFKNIKPGQLVYIFTDVIKEERVLDSFALPFKVTRTTNTMFCVENHHKKFRKSDGKQIGGGRNAYKIGDKPFKYSDRVIADESDKYDTLIAILGINN